MLSIEEALTRCLAAALPVEPELVPLWEALGRVLAEDLRSDIALPPWDNSAMDGYAVRAADLGGPGQTDCDGPRAAGDGVVMLVLETIAAGRAPSRRIEAGTTSAIMTGAPMPPGADAVVIREDSERLPDGRVRLRGGARPGQNVRPVGCELSPGDLVLAKGETLSPAAIGLAASIGRVSLQVARRLRVALIATGDEIVPPGDPLSPGQIWSANTLTLAGLVAEAGGLPVDCGIARDTLDSTRAAFARAMDCDLILSTGGVSVGDFDVVKQALGEQGDMRFWKVRMKPGKPLAFGVIGGRPAFGLPGNPVSCVLNFLQFVRPVLRRSMGDPMPFLPVMDAIFTGELLQRSTGREELIRVQLSHEQGRLCARPTGHQGSARLSSLLHAEGLMLVAADRARVETGDTVAVQLCRPGPWASAEPGYRW